MSVCALIAAAGSGRRMRMKGNKTHLLLRGKPILIHTLSAFQACQAVDDVILIVASDEIELTWGLIRAWGGFSKVRKVVSGGATRQESVLCGLGHIEPECEIVVIHDCARPLIRPSTIEMTIEAAREYGAAIVSVPMRDTIKVDQEGYVAETPERDLLRAARTPQAFQREIIEKAYISAAEEGFIATDDSMVVERLGVKVRLLDDELDNIKITYEEDLVIADSYLSRRSLEDERGTRNLIAGVRSLDSLAISSAVRFRHFPLYRGILPLARYAVRSSSSSSGVQKHKYASPFDIKSSAYFL